MSKVCYFCGKRPVAGRSISRRGLAKKKGGVGRRVTGVSKRRFLPNLQTVRAVVDGTPRRVKVCAKCIKRGRLIKP